ncbi:hypothetical protein P4129_29160 [Pseudomonas aeruginosa]|nr:MULTISPECIES: hypothetical protein [Burkholderiaceae]MDF5949446.1 hypothetical protein [Pseudomonas aeruginosa]
MSAPTAKLSFEIAQLRRLKFGKKSEQWAAAGFMDTLLRSMPNNARCSTRLWTPTLPRPRRSIKNC